jgi:predicted nucleotidyltransferase
VRLFASIARGEDKAGSDVDLLVTLDSGARPLDLLSLACDAEDILGVSVDVGTVEVGEAVKAISPELLARVPDVPWREIARMRAHLTHRYFDTQHETIFWRSLRRPPPPSAMTAHGSS